MDENIINIGIFVGLIILGFFAGSYNEKRHYKKIQEAEQELKNIVILDEDTALAMQSTKIPHMVTGSVVIALDYFKTFLFGFINFFGGRVSSYESLLDRARREATIRMKRDCLAQGYNTIANLKIESFTINGDSTRKAKNNGVEAFVYGTGMFIER